MYPYFLSTFAEVHRGQESSALYRKISMASKRLQSLFKGNNHLWISNPEAVFIGAAACKRAQEGPNTYEASMLFPNP